jgi:predicted ArsR family transcriptional regulator
MKINLPDNEKALWILKMRGAQSLAALAAELHITTEGARFQLLKLANEGLVQASNLSKGRGRPQQIWSLTASGHARFPDTHAELTVRLIQKMKETLGEEALQAVIEANGQEGISHYLQELAGVTELDQRVQGLANIRDREGYMTEFKKEKEGYLLIENHCPICAAAQACQGFCRSELNAFRTIFGKEVKVERVEHMLAGARRCAYRIQ